MGRTHVPNRICSHPPDHDDHLVMAQKRLVTLFLSAGADTSQGKFRYCGEEHALNCHRAVRERLEATPDSSEGISG